MSDQPTGERVPSSGPPPGTPAPAAPSAAPAVIQLTRADLDALLAEVAKSARESTLRALAISAGPIGPEIVTRPYRSILHPTQDKDLGYGVRDGKSIICVPPDQGGPIAIEGQHPDDYFGVTDEGVATRGHE